MNTNTRLLDKVQAMVRETAYNAAVLESSGIDKFGEAISRAKELYKNACELLRLIDPYAEKFIESTYQLVQVERRINDTFDLNPESKDLSEKIAARVAIALSQYEPLAECIDTVGVESSSEGHIVFLSNDESNFYAEIKI